jgi:peptidoglycan/LPS O-acetylase OafA/YrhL
VKDSNLQYRPDIDGLRAIAVLSVILFHSSISSFSGGFVGVDVFFVISGYLITKLIVNACESNSFQFTEFYVRRIRRLFPALLSTVTVTLLAGIILLQPDQVVGLSWTSISTLFSVSNIHFYFQSGYWDTSSLTKPLLHTWSLGVEEQFYMVWPAFIALLVFPLGKKAPVALFLTIVTSLATTIIITKSDSAAGFYLMPSRIYEFAIGSVCVWLSRMPKFERIVSGSWGSLAVALGLSLIATGVFFLEEGVDFPGWKALIPSIGTALVILPSNSKLSQYLLSNRVLRYLGLISYSLYLVHWPVLVFLTKGGLQPLTSLTLLFAIALMLMFAVAQYHLIEVPLRYPRHLSINSIHRGISKKPFFVAGITTLAVTCLALTIIQRNGFPERYERNIQVIASMSWAEFNAPRNQIQNSICEQSSSGIFCGSLSTQSRNIVIYGDSKGVDGLNILRTAYPDSNYVTGNLGGCPFVIDFSQIGYFEDPDTNCKSANGARVEFLKKERRAVDYLVISNFVGPWSLRATQDILQLTNALEIPVVFIGSDPYYDRPVADLIVNHGSLSGIDSEIEKHRRTDLMGLDNAIEALIFDNNGLFIEKTSYFCADQNPCRVILDDGMPILFDKHHLTISAAQSFGRYLKAKRPNLL